MHYVNCAIRITSERRYHIAGYNLQLRSICNLDAGGGQHLYRVRCVTLEGFELSTSDFESSLLALFKADTQVHHLRKSVGCAKYYVHNSHPATRISVEANV